MGKDHPSPGYWYDGGKGCCPDGEEIFLLSLKLEERKLDHVAALHATLLYLVRPLVGLVWGKPALQNLNVSKCLQLIGQTVTVPRPDVSGTVTLLSKDLDKERCDDEESLRREVRARLQSQDSRINAAIEEHCELDGACSDADLNAVLKGKQPLLSLPGTNCLLWFLLGRRVRDDGSVTTPPSIEALRASLVEHPCETCETIFQQAWPSSPAAPPPAPGSSSASVSASVAPVLGTTATIDTLGLPATGTPPPAPNASVAAPANVTGLPNVGNSCYLNSILQVWIVLNYIPF